MTADATGNRYRFAGLHRSGLFGSIPPTMLVIVATGVVASWLVFLADGPPTVALVPTAVGLGVGLARFRGQPLHELLPLAGSWIVRRARRRTRWIRPVELVAGTSAADLPPELQGLELLEVTPTVGSPARHPIAVVRDRTAGTVTAVLRVHGDGSLALADPATQDHRLGLWGLALAGFCREAGPVCRIAWHDWTSPTGVSEHLRQLEVDSPGDSTARRSYVELVRSVAPSSVRHEVLLAVTVDLRRTGRRHRRGVWAGVEVLFDETHRLIERLDHAGLRCDEPLNAVDLALATRVRSDPRSLQRLHTRRRSLAAAASKEVPNFGPMAIDERWDQVRVDGSVHRSWWFGRWPRREVPALWMDPLLFGVPCTRTISVVFEPIPPSRSDRDIDRESVARATNAEDKARRGFRVKAADRKAARDVELREGELNDGFGEFTYVGLLTATVDNPEQLDMVASTIEQVGAQGGIDLQPLYARQGAGWVASLPLGRTLARRVR